MKIEKYDEIIRIIRRRVTSRTRLIDSVNKILNLTIPKSTNYQTLIKKIESTGNEKNFCKEMYNVSSFEEILEKDLIEDALLAFPKETLVIIAKNLSNNKKNWKFTKSNVSDLKREIIYNTSLKDYEKLLPELIKNKQIPSLVQHYKAVIGILGITKAKAERRDYDADDLIDLLSSYITDKTLDNFQENCHFIPPKMLKDNENLDSAATKQLIMTHGTDGEIKDLFNILIEKELIKISTEEYHSIGITTPCGIITSTSEDPIKDMVRLVLAKTSKDALDNHLKEEGHIHGPLELRLYGKYLMTSPKTILNHEFGMHDLREIGKRLGLIRLEKIIQKEDLIRYLLYAMGFVISTEINGISYYIRLLEEYQNQFETEKDSEKIRGLMMNVYVQSEKILKDLIYFHIAIFWPAVQDQENKEDKLDAVKKIIRQRLQDKKDFSKPMFGQLVYLMKKMNSYVLENDERRKKLQKVLGREYVFPANEMEILTKIAESRGQYSHDHSTATSHEQLSSTKIIHELLSIAKLFKNEKIYPITFQVTHEITNQYGVSYLEAAGEDGVIWNIKTEDWLPPGTFGMMHSKTDKIAVFPLSVTKFW